MTSKVYLGYPPPNVRRWIENKYKKTIITFDNGNREEYDWTGEVSQETLGLAGIYDTGNYEWLKNPVSVQFGTTVTTVGNYAFSSCNSLESVSMPNVQTICADAFNSCTNLASVLMPNVTSIGETAFAYCHYLSTVSLPSTASVSDYAFYDISRSLSFINQSTEKISEWFGNWVFGEYLEPITVSCSNGSVYAEWNDNERKWNVTENPA